MNPDGTLVHVIQMMPHGISILNYPPAPGLREKDCRDMLGNPNTASRTFMWDIVKTQSTGILGLGGIVDPDSGITYKAAAFVVEPVYIGEAGLRTSDHAQTCVPPR